MLKAELTSETVFLSTKVEALEMELAKDRLKPARKATWQRMIKAGVKIGCLKPYLSANLPAQGEMMATPVPKWSHLAGPQEIGGRPHDDGDVHWGLI